MVRRVQCEHLSALERPNFEHYILSDVCSMETFILD